MTGQIPYIDFGGDGEVIHFAHPNAYPPACFGQFIRPFTSAYHVIAMEQRPLWPDQPPEGTQDLQAFVEDMICFFEQQGLQNVIGLGHSLGAAVTMMTAVKRPDLFSKLILIDPVFLAPSILEMAAQIPDEISNNPLSVRTRNRRNRWPDKQTAYDQYRAKKVFRRWSDEALWDYVDNAIVPVGQGKVGLRYSREWEARIYTLVFTFSELIWQKLPDLQIPTLAVRAGESDTVFPEAWALWQELQPTSDFVEVSDVSHMLIMERPLHLAELALDWLKNNR